MIVQTWVDVLKQSSYNLLWGVVNFLPSFLFAVIILIIGWFVGVLVGRIITEAVRALKVDHALKASGVEDMVKRAGYRLDSGMFIGALFKWFIIVIFLVASLQVMGLVQVTMFLQQIVMGFLPNVIVAVLILLVAAVVAEVAQGVVSGSARAAGVPGAGFAGTVARWSVWLFAVMAALEQLQIAQGVLQTLFTGVVVALALGFGLSFGLGGQEAAARAIERVRDQMKNHHNG